MRERVEADDVGGAEGRAPGAADQGAGQRIDGIETDIELLRVVDGRQHREHADAVGDEVGRVLGADHALAERGDEKFFEIVENAGIGFAARDQLDQMHVARRIEKMHAAKAVPQFRGKRLRQRVDRKSRSIAGEYGVLAEVRRDLLVEVGFPVHAL